MCHQIEPGSLTLQPSGQLKALNGLRGVAVLLVFMSHTSGRDMVVVDWANFHGLGHIGVYLFFVLSGYLLTRNLLSGQSYIQYFSRRFFRIAPLYFIVLTCVAVYQMLGFYSPQYLHVKGSWVAFLQHYFFIRGDGIFWTIPSEFVFYYLLPGIVCLSSKYGCKWIVGFSAIYFFLYLLAQFGFYSALPLKFIFINHDSQYLDVFFCGVIGGYFRYRLNDKITALLFWGIILLTLCCVSKSFLLFNRPFFELRWMSLLYGIIFMLAIVSAAQGNKWIAKPLSNRLICTIGVTGFGWYLLHMPVIHFINSLVTVNLGHIKFIICFVTLLVLNILVNRLIELPGIKFGHKFEIFFVRMCSER